jgi:hypothetical protein
LHSFASNHKLWEPGAARNNYREAIKNQVLADRAACVLERYQDREMNPTDIEERCGEPPLKLSVICGPRFLQRTPSTGEEDPEPEADGINYLGLDRDTEWETESE